MRHIKILVFILGCIFFPQLATAQQRIDFNNNLDSLLSIVREARLNKLSGEQVLDSTVAALQLQLGQFSEPEDRVEILFRMLNYKRMTGQNEAANYFNEQIKMNLDQMTDSSSNLYFRYYINQVIIETNLDRVSEALRILPTTIALATTDLEKSKIYNNSGRIYMELQDFQQAATYYKKDYDLVADKFPVRASHAAFHVGKNVDILFGSDSAWYWYDQTLKHQPKPIVTFQIKLYQADRLVEKGDFGAGLDSLLRLEGLQNVPLADVHLHYWEIMAESLTADRSLQSKVQEKYPGMNHLIAYDSCVSVLSSINIGDCEVGKMEGFAMAYAQLGDHVRAYETAVLAGQITSGQFEAKVENNLIEQNQLERLLSKQAIATREIKINQQRSTLYLSLLVGIVLILFVIYFYFNQRKLQLLNQKLSLQNEDIMDQRHRIEEQSNQLMKLDEMKSRFFINISHELRTPLTLIMGTTDHALKGGHGKVNDPLKNALQTAIRNCRRLVRMVNDILDLSKLEHGQLSMKVQPVDISSLTLRCLDIFKSKASAMNIRFDGQVERDLPLLPADEHKIESVILNLLGNAIRFTPEEGSIVVSLKQDSNSIKLMVTNHGIGIPKEDLPYVFDRFFQAGGKQQSEGSGVGLTLTKEIIDLHEGEIIAESEAEAGTTFTVTLPYRDLTFTNEEAQTDEGIPLSQAEFQVQEGIDDLPVIRVPGNFTLLVVEDNAEMRTYIEDLLRPHFTLEFAENGQAGLDVLKQRKVDLILTDYMMPIMDGFEFIKAVKDHEKWKNLPTIFLTARAEDDDKLQVLKHGVDDYVVKPFLADELLIRINNLLALQNERASFAQDDLGAQLAQDEFLKMIYAYAKRELASGNLDIPRLAEHLSVSERTLYRKVKAQTGFTPEQYIKEIKLLEARKLLERREKISISEVAFAVGFENVSHFSSSYKRRFGRPPSSYLS